MMKRHTVHADNTTQLPSSGEDIKISQLSDERSKGLNFKIYLNRARTSRVCLLIAFLSTVLWIFHFSSVFTCMITPPQLQEQKNGNISIEAFVSQAKHVMHSIPDVLGQEMGVLSHGYNVGDLLNMPSFRNTMTWPRKGSPYVESSQIAAIAFPYSIVGLYAKVEQDEGDCGTLSLKKNNCDLYPKVEYLRKAVDMWGEHFEVEAEKAHALLIEKEHVLLVHLRSGDRSRLTPDFQQAVSTLSKEFDETIIISGIHSDTRYADTQKKLNQLNSDITALSKDSNNVKVYTSGSADEGIFLMRNAKHLMVHGGGYSAIGALVCSGTVYYTGQFGNEYNLTKFETSNFVNKG